MMTSPSDVKLGDTQDATVLVPGDVSAVRAYAERMANWSKSFDATSEELKAVRIPSWSGQGKDAFERSFAEVPKGWDKASSKAESVAQAVDRYADAIVVAQGKGQAAIDAYNEAVGYDKQAEAARQAGETEQAEYYSNLADDAHQEAEELFRDAKNLLHQAGQETIPVLVPPDQGSTLPDSGSTLPKASDGIVTAGGNDAIIAAALARQQRQNEARDTAVSTARELVKDGVPYRFGGKTPDTGLDCSGFTKHSWKQAGVDIPAGSVNQANVSQYRDGAEQVNFTRANTSQLKPGDLLFWKDNNGRIIHVAMWGGEKDSVDGAKQGYIVEAANITAGLRETALPQSNHNNYHLVPYAVRPTVP